MSFQVEVRAAGWLEAILETLVAENFVQVLDGFLSRECPKFLLPGQEGHTLEQTAVHAQYVRFYESRIEAYLRKSAVAHDEFMHALLAADAAGTAGEPASLVASLLLVQDFEAFATMMAQRALEMPG